MLNYEHSVGFEAITGHCKNLTNFWWQIKISENKLFVVENSLFFITEKYLLKISLFLHSNFDCRR
jgi:hypothetical protein